MNVNIARSTNVNAVESNNVHCEFYGGGHIIVSFMEEVILV